MKLMQSIGGLLILAAAAGTPAVEADTSGSCTGSPPAAEQAPTYSTPDYAVEAQDDTAADAQAGAAQRAWTDYQKAILDGLRASPVPRDWALAANAELVFPGNGTGAGERDALVKRAMDAAPDDVLVQWIAVRRSHASDTARALAATALQQLQRTEPDNAAVWLEQLIPAQKRQDPVAVEQALSRMAAADRFDEHYADMSQALLEVYQRSPPPVFASGGPESLLQSPQVIPYLLAAAMASATALPAFQELVAACRIDPATGANSRRSGDCAAVGRLLAAQGDTQIANHIGMALLRVSASYNDDDVRRAREQDWLTDRFTSRVVGLFGSSDQASVDAMIAYQADSVTTRSEMEAVRLAVARAGEATYPPADWVDKASPYSAERLKQDQAALDNATQQP